uniref:Uncharacterized protein n=1 Tax=Anguilla anguilla TaxID=7936 RepID=A0A0E9TJT3_ANGAN
MRGRGKGPDGQAVAEEHKKQTGVDQSIRTQSCGIVCAVSCDSIQQKAMHCVISDKFKKHLHVN